MSLKDSCTFYNNLKHKAESLRAEMDELKVQMDKAKADLIEALDSEGLQSAKIDGYYFSKTVRHDLRIADEPKVWGYLEINKDLRNEVVIEKIDQLRLKSIAKKMLVETGEVVDGVEPVSTVSVTVKKA